MHATCIILTCILACTHILTFIHVRIHAHIHARTHVRTHKHTHACTHIHTHMCARTCTHTKLYRIGGVNRLFHIMHRNGLYDFAEPLEFHSVVELIEYYREHSLASYSPKLDITLQRPLSRFKMEQEESVRE